MNVGRVELAKADWGLEAIVGFRFSSRATS